MVKKGQVRHLGMALRKRSLIAGSLAFLLFIAFPALLSAQTLQGKVVHIADGDTLTVLVDHQQMKVRLAEIDAPESHQDYGQRAKQALGNLVFGQVVTVDDGARTATTARSATFT